MCPHRHNTSRTHRRDNGLFYSDFTALTDASLSRHQLIFSVFKTLTDQKVTVELKNDLAITGVLKSVDQYVFSHGWTLSSPSTPRTVANR